MLADFGRRTVDGGRSVREGWKMGKNGRIDKTKNVGNPRAVEVPPVDHGNGQTPLFTIVILLHFNFFSFKEKENKVKRGSPAYPFDPIGLSICSRIL